MTPAERAELRAWVAASREAQGLPETITDPVTLARAVESLRPANSSKAGRSTRPAPLPFSTIASQRPAKNAANGSPPNGAPL